jgi:DNA repair protein RecO (recombination protein O)
MSVQRQVRLQPAYVLHHRPYRDTSRILELFTRDHGRLTLFARGVVRGTGTGNRNAAKSASLLPLLQPFNRLLVSWSGRGEAGQLSAVEFDGAFSGLPPDRLLSGCYLNELLLNLLGRHDEHAAVFDLYARTIEMLKTCEDVLRPLRRFEKRLLEAIGYGLLLESEGQSGAPVLAEHTYLYRLDQGPVRVTGVADGGALFSGASLLALAREELADAESCADARRLLRAALDRLLEGRELKSRQVMHALQRTLSKDG